MKKWVEIIEWILEKYKSEGKLSSYRVNFDNFGAFSLNINVTYFTNETWYAPYLKEKEKINIEIKEEFAVSNLEMAFPTQELIIKKEA
jgi:small-conductance mechanosensitive channel